MEKWGGSTRGALTLAVLVLQLCLGGSSSSADANENEASWETGNALLDDLAPKSGFRIRLATRSGKTAFVEGERAQFTFRAERDCYVYLFAVDPERQVTLLAPGVNTKRDFGSDQVFLKAGQVLTVPPAEPGMRRGFPVVPPHGITLVKVGATRRPLALSQLRQRGGDLGALDGARMKALGREYARSKASGQSESLEPTQGRVVPLQPGSYATAMLRTLSGEDAADLERRVKEAGWVIVRPPEDPAGPGAPPAPPRSQPTPHAPGAFPLKPDAAPPLTGPTAALPRTEHRAPSDPSARMRAAWKRITRGGKSLPTIQSRAVEGFGPEDDISELLVVYEPGQTPCIKSLRGDSRTHVAIVPAMPDGTKALHSRHLAKRIAELEALPGVRTVIPNFAGHAFGGPDTELRSAQWALENRFEQGKDTGWHRVPEDLLRGQTVLMGLVDQGLTLSDPRCKALAWRNPREIPGNGLDDDGNGLADDVHGYDFVRNCPRLYYTSETASHGSFCASIAAGRRTGRGDDVLGIALGGRVITAVACDPQDPRGGCTFEDVVRGIGYVKAQGARVINLSLGGQLRRWEDLARISSDPIWDECERDGVILVCAAGNDGRNIDEAPYWPGGLLRPNIVTGAGDG